MVAKFVLAILSILARGYLTYRNINTIGKSDATTEQKTTQIEAKLEAYRARCAVLATETPTEIDDKILGSLADWMDEAAEAIVAKYEKEQAEDEGE